MSNGAQPATTARPAATPVAEPTPLDRILSAITDISNRQEELATKVAKLEKVQPQFVPSRPRVNVAPLSTAYRERHDTKAATGERVQEEIGQRSLGVDGRGRAVDFDQHPQLFHVGQVVRLNEAATRGTSIVHRRDLLENADGQVIRETMTEVTEAGWKPAQPRIGPKDTWMREERVLKQLNWGEVIDRLGDHGFIACPGLLPGSSKRRPITCRSRVRIGQPCERCGFGPEVRDIPLYGKYDGWKYIVVVPGLTNGSRGDGFTESELLPA